MIRTQTYCEVGSPYLPWFLFAHEPTQNWHYPQQLAECDGFIIVTAEYNHSIPRVLKNALDFTGLDARRKPVAFVGYGGVGAARAVEQLRLMVIELQMAPLKFAVHIGLQEMMGLRQGKTFEDFPHLATSAQAMLDDLLWWTNAPSSSVPPMPRVYTRSPLPILVTQGY